MPVFSELKTEKKTEKLPLPPEPAKSSASPRPVKKFLRDKEAPSIKDALAGKLQNDIISPAEQHISYSDKGDRNVFTQEELKKKWDEFVQKLGERPNLQSTLSKVPSVGDNFKLFLEVDNSVQQDLINSIKPELVAWLRKELNNSQIKLKIVIAEQEQEKIIYSDRDKYIEMVRKNPKLELLKKKFNLDFD